jgi:hypothetical protein
MSHRTPAFHVTAGLAAMIVIAALMLAAANTHADTASYLPGAPPTLVLNYQGRLSDPVTGIAKSDGVYEMTFALYDMEVGGSPLWKETRAVDVRGGLFSVLLGEMEAFPAIFDGRPLWLEITVGGDPQTSPRLRVTHVAYAFYSDRAGSAVTSTTADTAANAQRLGGQPPASYAAASHSHDATAITAGTLSTDRYSAYADLSAEGKIGESAGQLAFGNHVHNGSTIIDGSLGAADLAANSVDGGKIVDLSVGTADLANSSVTSAKIADGAVTSAKLASGVVPKFLSLNPYSAYLGGGATVSTGYGPYAGIAMPNSGTPGIVFGFTIPPDYVTGEKLTARLVWHTPSTSCGIELRPSFISVARPGREHLVGGGATTGLDAVGGTLLSASSTANLSGEKSYIITSPVSTTKLQPGDSIIFGLYRSTSSASDTCTDELKVQAVQVTY